MARLSNQSKRAVMVSFSALAVALAAAGAHAQQATEAKSPVPDETVVIIHAQKTSERLSKAPVAVSVVSALSLQRQGIASAQDLVTTVPNLQPSGNGFAIRGVGSNNSFSGYSTVATQIDGIYDPSSASLSMGLFDVGSVEVLRGPQGTVYGRNATAGAVNIATADPGKVPGFSADFQYGNYNALRARISADIPLSSDFAIRATAYRDVNDGYYPQYSAGDKWGKADQLGLRLNSRAKFGDNVTWRLSLNYSRNQNTVPLTFQRSVNVYPDADIQAGVFGPRQTIYTPNTIAPGVDQVTNNQQDITYSAARSRLTWAINDALSLTYLAGFSVLTDNGTDAATGVFSVENINTKTQTLSNELDLNYKAGPVNLVLGAYLYEDRQPSGMRLIHAGDTAPAPFNTIFNLVGARIAGTGNQISTVDGVDVVGTNKGQGTKSQALFGQGMLDVTSKLKLIAGVRGTWEQVNMRQIELVCPGRTITRANISSTTCPTIPFVYALSDDTNRAAVDFSKVSWKLGADYDVSDATMVYATVSTGFRGGGLQASGNAPEYRQYAPETVTNTEAGIRTAFLDNRLYVSGTAFNMDYKDLQVSSIVLNPTTNQVSAVTTNAATARLRGVELETTFRITSHDRLSGYLSYLDAIVTSYKNAADGMNSGGGTYNSLTTIFGNTPLPSNVVTDASGNRLANAPEWSGRVSYSHIFDLSNGGRVTPSLDFYAQSETYSDVLNYSQSLIKAYTKTDINIRYDAPSGHYSLTAYVNNLEDAQVPANLVSVWSSTTTIYRAPRTFGVRLGLSY